MALGSYRVNTLHMSFCTWIWPVFELEIILDQKFNPHTFVCANNLIFVFGNLPKSIHEDGKNVG